MRIEHKPLDITPEQRTNLITLAKGLLTIDVPDVKFDMSEYADDDSMEYHLPTCGTVGCAVGWAPFFGINKLPNERWGDYSRRVFGLSAGGSRGAYLFSSAWGVVDNTKQGAAKRIIYSLLNGVPYEVYDSQGYLSYDPSLYEEVTLSDLERFEQSLP